MPIEVISDLLSEQNSARGIQSKLVLQCAPLLKGIKVSAIINLPSQAEAFLAESLRGTELSYRVLWRNRGKILVFFYWEDAFARHIKAAENLCFLRKYGYREADTEKMLTRLSARIKTCGGPEKAFPHEIGVFLAYPLEDVAGFIRKKGRDYLLAGYWKVYRNPESAGRLFRAYDEAKKKAVSEFLAGRNLREIVVQAA